MYILDEPLTCRDGHSLIANDSWIIECPHTIEVISRSTNVTVVDDLPYMSGAGNFGEF